MDDDDAKHVLLTIRRMVDGAALEGVDRRYRMAFGLIGNIATEALQAKAQNRTAHFGTVEPGLASEG